MPDSVRASARAVKPGGIANGTDIGCGFACSGEWIPSPFMARIDRDCALAVESDVDRVEAALQDRMLAELQGFSERLAGLAACQKGLSAGFTTAASLGDLKDG